MKSLHVLLILQILATLCPVQAKIKIAFTITELIERGVQVSTFDYAHFNETILGNESYIMNFDVATDNVERQKWQERFPGRFFDCTAREYMDYLITQLDIDILYAQKPGHDDGLTSRVCKNAVHAYYPPVEPPHGDAFAFISQWFVDTFPDSHAPCVPLIVRTDETTQDLRAELHIPKNALVFGRHGGYQSFNLPFAIQAVKEVARERPDIYFLFLNTQEFCSLPNVIFLPRTTDMHRKAQFINTCDAMLHARWRGESFGLACAEFSLKNKPVITWIGSHERAHIQMLGDTGIYYRTKHDLKHILLQFTRQPEKNWNVHGQRFSPQVVMKQFDAVFIQPLIKNKPVAPCVRLPYLPLATRTGAPDEKNRAQLSQFFAHELRWIDCALMGSSQTAAIAREIEAIMARTYGPRAVIVENIHRMPDQLLAACWHAAALQGAQLSILDDALLISRQPVGVDPLIEAMTISRLFEIKAYAAHKTISDLLSSEQYIGWRLSRETERALPPLHAASRHLHLWKALALMQAKEYEKAAIIFEQLLILGFNHWRIHWYLGQAYYNSGDVRAEQEMRIVAQELPQFNHYHEFRKAISW